MKDMKLSEIEESKGDWNPKIQDIVGFKEPFNLISAEIREDEAYSDIVVEINGKQHTVETASAPLIDQLKDFIKDNDLGKKTISGVYLTKQRSRKSNYDFFRFASSLTK